MASQRGVMVEWLSAEQVLGPHAVCGGAGRQVPAAFAQVWQVPHETVAQQVRSTQLLETQSLPARQLAPFGFFTAGAHTIAVHTLPVAQSLLPPQLVRQRPARHR